MITLRVIWVIFTRYYLQALINKQEVYKSTDKKIQKHI